MFRVPRSAALLAASAFASASFAADYQPARCEIIPLPGQQVSLRIDGIEKLRWHFDKEYPRPFFHPFNGPSGKSLTRMGHPGAPNHDHHRSVWFAHQKVAGVDFWADPRPDGQFGRIRQKHWLAYADGDKEAIMATVAGWLAPDGSEIMEQETVAALIPRPDNEHLLELHLTLRPPKKSPSVQLEKTNFGFLAVRVAKSLSAHFGYGQLRDSEGRVGEPEIFGNPARWMDYSGPIAVGTGPNRRVVTEGVTFFDHPANPRHPTKWHVREDGWMGASFCMDDGFQISAENPLHLRYLLHAHSGGYDNLKAREIFTGFSNRLGFETVKSTRKHRQFEVRRRAK